MRRLKSIDEIYEEVKDYDLVITNDIALETALNARQSEPRVGFFAITPRHIAIHEAPAEIGRAPMKDIELITAIRKETGMDLRYIYSEIQNIREIGRFTSDIRGHLTTSNARKVYDSYEALSTVDRVMSNFIPEESDFFSSMDRIALIQPELFDNMDKHFSHMDADCIDIFREDEKYNMDVIHEVGNDRQLAENAVDLIPIEKADDFAIVLNPTSPIADAVKAALYRKGMPFINKMAVKDMAPIRDYLSFLTLSFNYHTLRVKHVKELFAAYNGTFWKGTEGYLLERMQGLEGNISGHYRELMREVCDDGLTFSEVNSRFMNSSTRPHVTTLLRQLDMEDSMVTPNELANLRYAVENMADLTNSEQTPDHEKRGVLLADCSNSVFIDRPVVIYLGMGQDWNKTVVGKRYMDVEQEMEYNAWRLEGLLQQGQHRIYMVNSTKNGKEARPSMLFDIIFGKQCETFSAICNNVVSGRWAETAQVPVASRGEIPMDSHRPDVPFSKSSFNAFYYCPRKYMFNSLLTDSDNKYSAFGNLIHAFAELYACHTDHVRSIGIDRFIDSIAEQYSGLSSPSMTDLDRDSIRKALTNVMLYLDRNGVNNIPLDKSNRERGDLDRNVFMDTPELDGCSSMCEQDRPVDKFHIHGKFDLFWENTVVDYKTGNPKTMDDLVKKMTLGVKDKHPEFQPLIYLALASNPQDNGKKAFRFDQFYVLDNDVTSQSDGDFDIMSNVRTIRLETGDAFHIAMSDPVFIDDLNNDFSKDFKGHAEALMECIEPFCKDDPSGWRNNEEIMTKVLAAARMSDCKTNREKKAGPAIGKVADHIGGGILSTSEAIIVPSEILDGFLEYLGEKHAEAMQMYVTDFPAAPVKGCDECEFKQACTRCKVTFEEGGESDE